MSVTQRTPAECLTADVTMDGRRFVLCLVKHLYTNSGVAVFTEVTIDNDANGEPLHDIYQDVGGWCIDGGGDVGGDEDGPALATPSVLKVDCLLPDDVARSAVMNALLEQIGETWSDAWERWQ
jgi:hypothetical protein